MPETDINSSGFSGPPCGLSSELGRSMPARYERMGGGMGGSHAKAAFSDLTVDQTTP